MNEEAIYLYQTAIRLLASIDLLTQKDREALRGRFIEEAARHQANDSVALRMMANVCQLYSGEET